jgi:hypothetical protein
MFICSKKVVTKRSNLHVCNFVFWLVWPMVWPHPYSPLTSGSLGSPGTRFMMSWRNNSACAPHTCDLLIDHPLPSCFCERREIRARDRDGRRWNDSSKFCCPLIWMLTIFYRFEWFARAEPVCLGSLIFATGLFCYANSDSIQCSGVFPQHTPSPCLYKLEYPVLLT